MNLINVNVNANLFLDGFDGGAVFADDTSEFFDGAVDFAVDEVGDRASKALCELQVASFCQRLENCKIFRIFPKNNWWCE